MEQVWRRFKIIGSLEDKEKLNLLMEDKKLTREDLTLILETIALNNTSRTGNQG